MFLKLADDARPRSRAYKMWSREESFGPTILYRFRPRARDGEPYFALTLPPFVCENHAHLTQIWGLQRALRDLPLCMPWMSPFLLCLHQPGTGRSSLRTTGDGASCIKCWFKLSCSRRWSSRSQCRSARIYGFSSYLAGSRYICCCISTFSCLRLTIPRSLSASI